MAITSLLIKEIKNAEIAQRTKETAPSLQLDNSAPVEYFFGLVADFEQRMQFYKYPTSILHDEWSIT